MEFLKKILGFSTVIIIISLFIVNFELKKVLFPDILFISFLYASLFLSIYLINYYNVFLKKQISQKRKAFLKLTYYCLLFFCVYFAQKLFVYLFVENVLPSYFLYSFPLIIFLDNFFNETD